MPSCTNKITKKVIEVKDNDKMRLAKRKTASHRKAMVVKKKMTKTLGTLHPKQASSPNPEMTRATVGCTPKAPRV
jgi:hypothetical protein